MATDAPRPAAQTVPRWATLIATWFGCGYGPVAPGTWGSLGALPVYALLSYAPLAVYALAVIALTVLGVISAERLARANHEDDPGQVVIDEVVGALIALGCVYGAASLQQPATVTNPWHLAVAWLLFRALDILKPWPLSAAERAKPLGLGIMLDDLLAGVGAGVATVLIF